ncbi:MAG: hypothetical protein HY720_01960 [Planctomycetes bacterium]|nr:hypothetical protein [Planctomycetota bacterium]
MMTELMPLGGQGFFGSTMWYVLMGAVMVGAVVALVLVRAKRSARVAFAATGDTATTRDTATTGRPQVGLEESEQIRRSISSLNSWSFLLGIPGIVLCFLGLVLPMLRPDLLSVVEMGAFLVKAGTGLLIVGLCCYARMKGRSAAWGLLGALSIIGVIILGLIEKICRHCKHPAGYSTRKCPNCGAPM